MEDKTTAFAVTDLIHCFEVNKCKGHNDCGTDNNSCAGHAECKGQGFVALCLLRRVVMSAEKLGNFCVKILI